VHAACPAQAVAMVPAEGSHVAPAAVYLVKHVLHAVVVTYPGIEQ
jgi:hypothetical protein